MSTPIRISEETKEQLELLKRDDETFDELLGRLAITRTETDVREMAGGGGDEVELSMERTRESLNESLDERTREQGAVARQRRSSDDRRADFAFVETV